MWEKRTPLFLRPNSERRRPPCTFTSGGDRAFEQPHAEASPASITTTAATPERRRIAATAVSTARTGNTSFACMQECPYQPGKLTALDGAVKFQVKGVDDEMAVFRVEKNRGYTVMSNHHLRNKDLSLKAKGLLSQMLSLPENWDYTLERLVPYQPGKHRRHTDGGVGAGKGRAISPARRTGTAKGKMADMVYTIYEQPQPRPEAAEEEQPGLENPVLENPTSDNPTSENPVSGNPMQLNKDIPSKEKSNTDLSSTQSIPIHSPNPSPAEGKAAAAAGTEAKGMRIRAQYRVYRGNHQGQYRAMTLLKADLPYDRRPCWTRL